MDRNYSNETKTNCHYCHNAIEVGQGVAWNNPIDKLGFWVHPICLHQLTWMYSPANPNRIKAHADDCHSYS